MLINACSDPEGYQRSGFPIVGVPQGFARISGNEFRNDIVTPRLDAHHQLAQQSPPFALQSFVLRKISDSEVSAETNAADDEQIQRHSDGNEQSDDDKLFNELVCKVTLYLSNIK